MYVQQIIIPCKVIIVIKEVICKIINSTLLLSFSEFLSIKTS